MRQRSNTLQAFCFCLLSALSAIGNDHATALAAERDKFLTGQILVATPEMKDPRFAESVIYLVKHDGKGAMGLAVNKPLAKTELNELLKGFGVEAKNLQREVTIHYGGPVSPRQGFLLHSDDFYLAATNRIANGIAMSSDNQMLEALARGYAPRQSLFLLGYAGWAPGQLEAELKMNSWYIIPSDKSLIFSGDADRKWRQALDKRQIPL
jgi:putative transcriptional regulator